MRTITRWSVGVMLAVWGVAPSGALAQSPPTESTPVAARQPTPPTGTRSDRRWALSVDPFGGVAGGPAADLEQAMRSAQLGDVARGFGTTAHPYSGWRCQAVLVLAACGEGRLPVFELSRTLRRPWSLAIAFSRTPFGFTTGYRRDADQFLTLEHQVDSVAALMSIGGRAAHAGFGPALHVARVRTSALPAGRQSEWTSRTALGLVARVRSTVPARSRLFVELRAEYHVAGRVSVGPYTAIPGPLGAFLPHGLSNVTLPSTAARFDYWLIGTGLGVRF